MRKDNEIVGIVEAVRKRLESEYPFGDIVADH